MSEELIKLSDAIKAIQYSNLDTLNVEERVALIKTIPTIELKRGEWVEVQISENFKRMVCSECGDSYVTDLITPLEAWIDNRHRFCSNCGADMRGKDDED